MTPTTAPQAKIVTFEQYLAYDDGTDIRYEWVDGELIEMPPESPQNDAIAVFLLFAIGKLVPIRLLSLKGTEIETSGRRARCRTPDLLVHTEESRVALASASRATLTRDMPPPALVIEIVSPGAQNRTRDYRHKHTEYSARGIAEYWIVDPEEQRVTVCQWVEGQYEDRGFRGAEPIESVVLPSFAITADQLFAREG